MDGRRRFVIETMCVVWLCFLIYSVVAIIVVNPRVKFE